MVAALRTTMLAAWLVAAIPAGGADSGAQPAPAATAVAADLHWLAGTWVSETAATRTEERWTSPAGGGLLGTSRTLRGDRMMGFEFLRIVTRERTLVYVAQPGGQPPTEFPMTEAGPGLAVFENPAHDFPQRLRYQRSDRTLVVSLDGVEGGTPARLTLTFTLAPGNDR